MEPKTCAGRHADGRAWLEKYPAQFGNLAQRDSVALFAVVCLEVTFVTGGLL